MSSAEWNRVKELFAAAIELDRDARERLLAGESEEVRRELSVLIDAHSRADEFIAAPVVEEFGLDRDSSIDRQIGSYRLVERVGAGGMGTVFRAEKEGFGGSFAIKIIKRGMDTDAVLRRFEMERAILARLEHPNIARLIDGGTTDDGVPYFVMEFVDGVSLVRFCDERDIGIGGRLELFREICGAVAYAHQALIVHRDIKPSNILVTSDGRPKLLDFGIAKMLGDDDAENSPTETQSRMFTPEYASPEQLGGSPVTTVSDVYSLGVVLYELLSGQRPFKTKSGNAFELANLILTEDPVRPSSLTNHRPNVTNGRVDSPADSIGAVIASTRRDRRQLEGDLDNIILKSLRREPDRRYQSVADFSEDVRRFLVGLPVVATGDSRFYRFSKFVARHRRGVASAAAAGVFIIGASGAAVWQGITATRERERAEQRFEQVRKLANSVIFDYHDGLVDVPGTLPVRAKMVNDSLFFLDSLSAETSEDVDLRREVVRAYVKVASVQDGSGVENTGGSSDAVASLGKAAALQTTVVERTGAESDRALLASVLIDLAFKQRDSGDQAAGEDSVRRALGIYLALPETSENRSRLAKGYWYAAMLNNSRTDFDSSLQNFGKALEIYEKLVADGYEAEKNRRNVALTSKNIGSVLQVRGRRDEALSYFKKALSLDRENALKHTSDQRAQLDLAFTIALVAGIHRGKNEIPQALEYYRESVAIREKAFAFDRSSVFAEQALGSGYQGIAQAYHIGGNLSEARLMYERAQQILSRLSKADPTNLSKQGNLAENTALLARLIGDGGQIEKSLAMYSEAFAIFDSLLANQKLANLDKRKLAIARIDCAELLLKVENRADALKHLLAARELFADPNLAADTSGEIERMNALIARAERAR